MADDAVPMDRPDEDRPHLGRLGRSRLEIWLIGTIAFVVVGMALHATSAFVTPILFAAFLALMLAPLVAWVKERVPERLGWLSYVAAGAVLLLGAAAFLGGILLAAQRVLAAFPGVGGLGRMMPGGDGPSGEGSGEGGSSGRSGASEAAGAGEGPSAGAAQGGGGTEGPVSVSEAVSDFAGVGQDLAGRLTDVISTGASAVLNAATATLSGAVLAFFLTLLMLIEADGIRRRVSRLLDPDERGGVFESAEVIGRQLRRYLAIRAAMGALTAVLYVAWLWITGVDLLLVWALLTFLLSFVPTLGSIAAGLLPTAYALVTRDVGGAVLVGAGLLVIEQVIGNFVDPRISGRLVSVSPLVILISLVAWGWLLGAPGLLLAVPLTIAAMVICAHVRPLRPVALMLSDRTRMEDVDELASR